MINANSVLMRDRSEHRQTARSCVESDPRPCALLDHSPSPMSIAFPETRFRKASEGCRRALSTEQEQGPVRGDAERFSPDSGANIQAENASIIAAGTAPEFEESGLCRNGRRVASVSRFPIRSEDDPVTALGSVVADTAAFKHAEWPSPDAPEQLGALLCASGAAGTDKSRHEGRSGQGTIKPDTDAMVAMIARDLLAPLRNIEMLASQVRDDAVELNAMARRLDLITRSSARLTRLCSDLLVNLRPDCPNQANVQTADLDSIVADARNALGATARSRRIHWNIGNLPKAAGIPVLLKVAFEQVLSNAVKFTQQCDPAIIDVAAIAGGSGEVVIEIKDNGVGFSERHAHKLFGAFQRLHSDSRFAGVGLGLITARRIIEGHGGRVWASSRPNEGASFYLALRAAAPIAPGTMDRTYHAQL